MTAPDPIPGVEIRARRRRDGSTYYVFRVRWKDPVTGSRLVETLHTREDALDFQAHLRLAKRRGVLSELDLGRELLVDVADEWSTRFAKHELAKTTRTTYASMWNTHLLPRVGHLQLRQIAPGVVDQLKATYTRTASGTRRSARPSACCRRCCAKRSRGTACG